MYKVKFFSYKPYYFIRHDNIGYYTDDIKKYNRGIQFRQGVYETDDINEIKALRHYIRNFTNKGVRPPIYEEGQEVKKLPEIVKEEKTYIEPQTEEYRNKLLEIEDFLKR